MATVSQFYKALFLIIIYVAAKGTACSDLCHIYAYLAKYFFEPLKFRFSPILKTYRDPQRLFGVGINFSKFEIMKNIKRHIDTV